MRVCFNCIPWQPHETQQALNLLVVFFLCNQSQSAWVRTQIQFPEFLRQPQLFPNDSHQTFFLSSLHLLLLSLRTTWIALHCILLTALTQIHCCLQPFRSTSVQSLRVFCLTVLHTCLFLDMSRWVFKSSVQMQREHEGLRSPNRWLLRELRDLKGSLLGVTMVTSGCALLFGRVYSDCLLSRLIWRTAREAITGLLKGPRKKSHRAARPCWRLMSPTGNRGGDYKGGCGGKKHFPTWC